MTGSPDAAMVSLMQSQTDAIWFQASVSILTILGAFGVVVWQHHFERLGVKADAARLGQERRTSLSALMLAVLEQARLIRTFQGMPGALNPKQFGSAIGNAGRQLEGFRNLLSSFDLAPFSDPAIWKAFADVFGILGIVHHRSTSWEAMLTQDADGQIAANAMKSANDLLDVLIERAEAAVTVLNVAPTTA